MKRSFFAAIGTGAATACLAATPALAHTGAGATSGLSAGLLHPIGGLDHLLAMVAVGVLAAQQGGRALWIVPAAFVGMTILGGVLAIAGVGMPMVEIGILGSVIVLGGAVALGKQIPLAVAAGLVGLFAIFHGHAHGAEMPAGVSGVEYAVGFALVTMVLHATGIGLCFAVRSAAGKLAPFALRATGVAVTGAGVALAVG